MQKDLAKLLTLAAITAPSLFALYLTDFIPASSQENFGIGLFGLFGTAVVILAGFGTEMKSRSTPGSYSYTLKVCAAIAAIFIGLIVLDFLSVSR